MGIFSCPCVVCVSGWCVCAGSRGLLKLSQDGRNWQVGRRWERCRRQSGIGGYSHKRITGGLRRYSDFRITVSEAMAILDNLYRKCYNKCNDDNKNVISHQTGKNAPTSRFCLQGYKITPNTEKRRTANLHKIWKYKMA